MRQRIITVAASLAAGLPIAWSSTACDGFDTTADTLRSTAAAPTRSDHLTFVDSNALSRTCGAGQPSSSQFDLTFALRYLFGVVHASAEAPVTVPLDAAFRVSLLQPILSYMPDAAARGEQALTASTLQALEAAAVAGFTAGGDPTQVVTVAWALAWAGHEPSQRYVDLLQAAASSGSLPGASSGARLGAAHRAVLLWCAAMHGAATPPVWESGLRAVAAAAAAAPGGVKHGLDECALLYLLHATLLYGVDAAVRRPGASGAVSPTSPAAASAASPACQPRATREEVLAAAAPLGRKALEKLAAAYGEYVPLHPAIEGPYLALLYVLKQLAVGGGGGAAEGAATAAEGRWAPPGAAEQAAAVLSNPKDLARIKRDLLYHWRGDTLVDELQRARNQLVYLLTRRLGLTVSQPEDVDVAVPSRWLAIYVRGGGGEAAAADASAAASVPDLESAASEALEVLMRDRFAPLVRMPGSASASASASATSPSPAGGGSLGAYHQPPPQQEQPASQGQGQGQEEARWGCGPEGMWKARVRQLRRLGWRVAVVDVEAWRQLPGDAEREAYLARLLRGRA